MNFIYALCYGSEWEDLVIFLSREDAIKESMNHPNHRVEIFRKSGNSGYIPTYNYYKNGEYIQNAKKEPTVPLPFEGNTRKMNPVNNT